jgi:phage terminase large subunit-like protein
LAGCGSAAKFVPQAYLHNAAEVRLAVLQGLMDTDGSITQTGAMEFSTASERLAENVEFLVHSLGGKVSVERRQTKFTNKHGDRVNGLPSLRLRIRLNVCPFRLPRKAERWTPRKNTPNRVIHHIEAAGAHECTCIEVAHHDHTFVTAHGIVTHNTVAAGTETTYHLTGKYPNWWDGRRFDRPVRALASGDTHETTRDILQLKMVGATTDKPENIGTGLIPGDDITGIVPRPHVKGAIEKVTVRHVSGGESELWLRSYEQGREIFQGFELDIFWPDEECPEDVYEEGQVRLMTRNGISMLTFTPLNGLTKLVQQLTAKTDDPVVMASRSVVQCGWDHVPHLDEDAKARLLAKLMPHQRDARTKGVPSLGAGAIYPVPETDIVVDDFALPAYWPRAYGMDVGWNRTAAIWGAHDREADVVYLYSEHYRSQAEPSIHADAIKARGVWIPGAIDPAARGRQQKDGEQLLQNYQDLGLDLTAADNAREAGIYNVWQRLSTGRMKVFKSLQNWLNEYRIYRRDDKGQVVKENDHAMDATRYLEMSGIAVARVPPRVEKPARRGNWRTV